MSSVERVSCPIKLCVQAAREGVLINVKQTAPKRGVACAGHDNRMLPLFPYIGWLLPLRAPAGEGICST